MRLSVYIAATLIAGCIAAKAADTAIGPVLKTCQQVNEDDVATKKLTLVWLYGYASGVNYSSSTDFIIGRDGTAFVEHLRAVCELSPNKGLLTAAREIVVRLKNEAAQRQNSK
jgi:hypothetical protein